MAKPHKKYSLESYEDAAKISTRSTSKHGPSKAQRYYKRYYKRIGKRYEGRLALEEEDRV